MNLDAVGASIRVEYSDGTGPRREVVVGGAAGSQDHLRPLLGLRAEPIAIHVRWPDGTSQRQDVPIGTRQLRIRQAPSVKD